MIIFNKLDNYFAVSADSQTFLGFEMTANFRDTSPLRLKLEHHFYTFHMQDKSVLVIPKIAETLKFL